MAFLCPQCHKATLEISERMELAADSWSDEITLQAVACSACGLRAAAAYEESRRGALDSEAWHHTGYLLDPAAATALAGLIAQCPNPSQAGCACPAHAALGQVNSHGAWDGLRRSGIAIGGTFPMRYAD